MDTLIYGIFFPSDGKCETYLTKQTCLLPQAKLGGNQSTWEKEATVRCSPKEPPSNVITVLILALVITVLMRPALILVEVMAKACECRPRFESWSKHWSTNSWIGSLHHASYLDYSPLAMAFVHHEKNKKLDEQNNVSANDNGQEGQIHDVDVELGTYLSSYSHTHPLRIYITCYYFYIFFNC